MPVTPARPSALNLVSGKLLQQDLLTPASPVTPSSSTAYSLRHPHPGSPACNSNAGTPFVLSAPPTPTFASSGTGVLVKMSDGTMAVRTVRKTLRIDTDNKSGSGKDKCQELVEGTEVEFRTDGTRAFDIKRRMN